MCPLHYKKNNPSQEFCSENHHCLLEKQILNSCKYLKTEIFNNITPVVSFGLSGSSVTLHPDEWNARQFLGVMVMFQMNEMSKTKPCLMRML